MIELTTRLETLRRELNGLPTSTELSDRMAALRAEADRADRECMRDVAEKLRKDRDRCR